MPPVLVLATPHSRHDRLEARIRERLSGFRIIRLRERTELTTAAIEHLAPSWLFFPHWSWRIPANIHSRFSCVIFHMTDVPYGRGGSPLQNLIVRGHRTTVLSALKCVDEVDAGPVYLKRPLSLEGTAEEILQRAAVLMEDMIAEIVQEQPVPVPQQGDVVTFDRRHPQDGDLAQLQSIESVYDFIRMLDAQGYPRAFLQAGPFHLEFSEARLSSDAVEAKVRISRSRNGG